MVWGSDEDAPRAPPFGGVPVSPPGRRPRHRPRTRWRDYISWLAWDHLGIPRDEFEEVAGERDGCAALLPP